MTKAKSEFRKYLDKAGELPRDVLLGHIVMFTINDGQYDRTEVDRWFDELQLDPQFVPEQGKAIDAYKKATSEANGSGYPLSDGNTAEVLVRDVSAGKDTVIRHLIREVKDPKAKRLAYNKIAEAIFYRPTVRNGKVEAGTERFRLTIDHPTLLPNERAPMDAVVEQVSAAYDRYCNYMDGMKVRAMVRDYVLHLNGIALKAGVYFVHVSRVDELERLATLVDRLGNGCMMHLMPMVDLDTQRDMVVEAFQAEAAAQLTNVVREISHLRETRKKITPDAYAKVKAQYDSVMTKASEYTRTLKISEDRTEGAAEIALDALAALQQQMLGAA